MRSSSSSSRSTRVSARLPESWRISSRWRGVNFSWNVLRLVCLLFVFSFMSHLAPNSWSSSGRSALPARPPGAPRSRPAYRRAGGFLRVGAESASAGTSFGSSVWYSSSFSCRPLPLIVVPPPGRPLFELIHAEHQGLGPLPSEPAEFLALPRSQRQLARRLARLVAVRPLFHVAPRV